MKILPPSYYLNRDVVFLSRDLLGKVLMTNFQGELTGGIITETEAYCGPDDRASHAYGNKKTKRNTVMYAEGGVCYVYRCYGIHNLFNIVTNRVDIPHAILIRAIKPIEGLSIMLRRRNKTKLDKSLCSGPGTLTQALGIELTHNGLPLSGPSIWIEDRGIRYNDDEVRIGPRVGIDYAKEDALQPWRFQYLD